MSRKRLKSGLAYLENKPKKINWEVIAGSPLSDIQMFDLVYDDYDLKIRQIDKRFSEL